ncbi:carbonic anhydrase [Sphingomonas sp. UYAg733]
MSQRFGQHTLASRRRFLGMSAIGWGALALDGPVLSAQSAPPKPQNVVTPNGALDLLRAGNKRYVEGTTRRHDFAGERQALSIGQNPYAAILGCADSRIAPEFAFDSSRGDLFVVRVAGNIVSDEGLASLEYAVANLGTPLILVLGHEACGAVGAAIKSVTTDETLPGHLPGLVEALRPAVEDAQQEKGDLLANTTAANVRLTAERLSRSSLIISALVDQGRLAIHGGLYRLGTGRVDFLD